VTAGLAAGGPAAPPATRRPRRGSRRHDPALAAPHWGTLRLPATAVRVGDLRPAAEPGPALGTDTEPLLRVLAGIDGARLARLRAAGAFGTADPARPR
jgi:hypothetical protein